MSGAQTMDRDDDLPDGLSDRGDNDDFIVVDDNGQDGQDQDGQGQQDDPHQGLNGDQESGFRAEEDEAGDRGGTRNSRAARRRAFRIHAAAEDRRRLAEQASEIDALRAKIADFDKFRATAETRFRQSDQGQHSAQLVQIDREMQTAAEVMEQALAREADAVSTGDTEAFKRARQDSVKAQQRGYELNSQKLRVQELAEREARMVEEQARQPERREQPQSRERQAPAQPPLTPAAQQRMRDFQSRHDWIPFGDWNDPTWKTVAQIDLNVANEGYNPGTDAYWQEIERRVAARFPEEFEDTGQRGRQPQQRRQETPPQRRGPMAGPSGNGGGQGGGGARRVTITPERKQALMEQGVLDQDGTIRDRPKLDRMLKRYAEFDRTNSGAAH